MSIDELFETRKVFVRNMIQCFSDIETPSSFCIDAGWGYGKTTFLDVLSEELVKSNYCVLRFNSWENDYEQDPFTSLLSTMLPQINKYLTTQEKAEEFAVDLVCNLIAATMAVTKAITSIKLPLIPSAFEIGKDTLDYLPTVKKWMKGKEASIPITSPQQECVEAFKANLLDLSNKLDYYVPQFKKIVVLIDELDRCRPSFAIELLERVKHILNQKGYVFIFALNKQALESTVRNIYGEVDPYGYLRRFFDYELALPEPELFEFSYQLCKDVDIPEIKKNSLEIFPTMVARASCSLRDVEKMIKKLVLTLRIIPNETYEECMNFFLPLCIITMSQDPDWNKDYFTDSHAYENKKSTYQKSECFKAIQKSITSVTQKMNERIQIKGGLFSLFSEYEKHDFTVNKEVIDFYFNDYRLFSFTVPGIEKTPSIPNRIDVYSAKLDSNDFIHYRNILKYLYQLVNSISTNTNLHTSKEDSELNS